MDPQFLATHSTAMMRPKTFRASQITGSFRRDVVLSFLVAGAYYAGAELGFRLTPHGNPIALLWPPNAILLAALLLAPARRWPMFLLVVLAAHMFGQLRNGIPANTAL